MRGNALWFFVSRVWNFGSSWCPTNVVASPTELPLVRAAEHLAARRFAEAAGAFRAALSIDPNEPRAYLGLADCACGRGSIDEAVEELVGAAQDFAEREFHDAAFVLLGKALTLAPERLELHVDVAELEAATGRLELACTRLRNLAHAYHQAGQHDEGEAIGEVLASWESEAAAPEPAAPEPVRAVRTEPELGDADATSPERDFDPDDAQALMRASKQADPPPPPRRTPPATPRRAPPPPPPVRAARKPVEVQTGAPTIVRTAPSSPAISLVATLGPSEPARRGPTGRHGALRWRPSTLCTPSVAEASEPARAAKPGKVVGKRKVVPPPRATPKAAKKASSPKRTIAPAPSPKRGGLELARLPGRDSAPTPAAAVRLADKRTAVPPPVAPSNTTRYGLGSKPKIEAVVARVGKPANARVDASAAKDVPPPPSIGGSKGSLAARLRAASNTSAKGTSRKPGSRLPVEIDEDDPTSLWAPEGLLL